ncbi:hypothetical protein HZA40_04800 [Candidatus Peregrinibacteria bacterium]|nr:hypothetical protein [Candidatus Peregrinibacteria bacterium]
MLNFSQNKKIAISAVALFAVSLTTMIFFLGGDVKGGADVLEAGSDGVDKVTFSTGVSGNITEASADFCRILNKNCAQIVKKSLYDYINKVDFPDFAATVGKLAQKAQNIEAIGPIRFKIDGANEKMFILNAQSVQDREGKVNSINFSVKDITNKVEDIKNNNGGGEEDPTKSLMENLYPKIKDMGEQGSKLLVRLSYKAE